MTMDTALERDLPPALEGQATRTPAAASRFRTGIGRLGLSLRGGESGSSTDRKARRFASLTFMIRVANAGLVLVTQILLARWIGGYEFGIYTYVWAWVVLLGALTQLGLAASAQRFVPEYVERGEWSLLRGYVTGARWMAVALSTAFVTAGAILIHLFSGYLDAWLVVPLYLGLACVPMFALTSMQEGLARSYDWPQLAMGPGYFLRPLLLIAILVGFVATGRDLAATEVMWASLAATWVAALVQLAMLDTRLRKSIARGPRAYAPRLWLKFAFAIYMVDGFYLLLTHCDIILLQLFVEPDQVGIYSASVKLASVVSFVYFAVSAAAAHKFTELQVSGRGEELNAFMRTSVRWTFLPSLAISAAIVALGKPLLWLFGPEFVDGYPLLAILVVGLLARASVGPVERLLTMCGQQTFCALIYASAFVLNIALNLFLVPKFGLPGAAIATATALVVESILLFLVAKRRLGIHAFFYLPGGRPAVAP